MLGGMQDDIRSFSCNEWWPNPSTLAGSQSFVGLYMLFHPGFEGKESKDFPFLERSRLAIGLLVEALNPSRLEGKGRTPTNQPERCASHPLHLLLPFFFGGCVRILPPWIPYLSYGRDVACSRPPPGSFDGWFTSPSFLNPTPIHIP